MDIKTYEYIKKTKTILVFFCLLLIVSCQTSTDIVDVSINYKKQKAVSISFTSDFPSSDFSVHLKNSVTAILGNFSLNKNTHTFTPIIPFSSGQEYQLLHLNKIVASFNIENNAVTENPKLLAIYPTTDTVPENILKMYFQFSKPMQEVGKSLDYIKVVNMTTNQEVEVFLELETELWNKEHTILTLWFDPGRIKTDLIPNKEKGLPIIEGNEYLITVSNDWKDAKGSVLAKEYTKNLIVKERDSQNPDVNNWKIQFPNSESKEALLFQFTEPLDFMELTETMHLLKENGEIVIGQFTSSNNEMFLEFIPEHSWEKGTYKIIIKSYLEDLAGNNLNHLFDVDLENNSTAIEQTETKTIQFVIE